MPRWPSLMTNPANNPKRLVLFSGPVCLNRLEDGSFMIAGPNDRPIMIRPDGKLMGAIRWPLATPDQYVFEPLADGDMIHAGKPNMRREGKDEPKA